jgi:hypothetical protein
MTRTPDLLPEAPGATALIEEALGLVHLSSAVFLRGEFTAPWAFTSRGPREYAAALCPGAERLVLFHIVLEGRCRVRLESGEETFPGAGEAVVLPYGDRHVMGHPGDAPPVPVAQLLPPPPWTAMPVMRHGGGGPPTRILCGYLHCQDLLFQPLGAPAVDPRAALHRARGRVAACQRALRPGGGRQGRRLQRAPAGAAARRLPAAVHRRAPRRAHRLAGGTARSRGGARPVAAAPGARGAVDRGAAGAPRRGIAQRARRALCGGPGSAALRYLAQWRLQLASHLLRSTGATVPEIAGRVGYRSEATFSRAFKRGLGLPPAAWRARPR